MQFDDPLAVRQPSIVADRLDLHGFFDVASRSGANRVRVFATRSRNPLFD
jgi:hypothetical protein